jgi:hypothetical protein
MTENTDIYEHSAFVLIFENVNKTKQNSNKRTKEVFVISVSFSCSEIDYSQNGRRNGGAGIDSREGEDHREADHLRQLVSGNHTWSQSYNILMALNSVILTQQGD